MVRRAPAYVPSRGDVVWITLAPTSGHEQAGRRPAVVVSPRPYNEKSGLALMCPVTSRIKGYPFEVRLPDGLPVGGAILADQVRNLDWRGRSAGKIADLPARTLAEVLGKLRTLVE